MSHAWLRHRTPPRTPLRGTRPHVGFRPTTAFECSGVRIEPGVGAGRTQAHVTRSSGDDSRGSTSLLVSKKRGPSAPRSSRRALASRPSGRTGGVGTRSGRRVAVARTRERRGLLRPRPLPLAAVRRPVRFARRDGPATDKRGSGLLTDRNAPSETKQLVNLRSLDLLVDRLESALDRLRAAAYLAIRCFSSLWNARSLRRSVVVVCRPVAAEALNPARSTA